MSAALASGNMPRASQRTLMCASLTLVLIISAASVHAQVPDQAAVKPPKPPKLKVTPIKIVTLSKATAPLTVPILNATAKGGVQPLTFTNVTLGLGGTGRLQHKRYGLLDYPFAANKTADGTGIVLTQTMDFSQSAFYYFFVRFPVNYVVLDSSTPKPQVKKGSLSVRIGKAGLFKTAGEPAS